MSEIKMATLTDGPSPCSALDCLADEDECIAIERRMQEAQSALFEYFDKMNDGSVNTDVSRQKNKPIINVAAGNIDVQAKELESALEGHVYQRGGQLVEIINLPHAGEHRGVRRPTGSTIIDTLTYDSLYLLAAKHASWQKSTSRNKATPCNPDAATVRGLLAGRGHWKVIRQLRGLINCPVLFEDGSVLQKPGYDEASGLFGDFNPEDFPKVKDTIHDSDVDTALSLLNDLISEFPFVSDIDKSVALSAILSSVLDTGIKKPLLVFSANCPGTGKSTLADIIAIIATGKPAPAMTYTPDEIELRKTVFALLMEGTGVVLIDNISTDVKSDCLNIALTQDVFKGRILGRSEMAEVPSQALWLMTGNNLTICGDLTRRTLVCNLDAGMEKPAERHFKCDIYQFASERRGEIVHACLTILAGYAQRGFPGAQDLRPMASFNTWSRLVRGALLWTGHVDPLLSQNSLEGADPERLALASILTAWRDAYPDGRAVTAADLLNTNENSPAGKGKLRQTIMDNVPCRGTMTPRTLSRWLARYKGRIVQGLRVVMWESNKHATLWKVEKI